MRFDKKKFYDLAPRDKVIFAIYVLDGRATVKDISQFTGMPEVEVKAILDTYMA